MYHISKPMSLMEQISEVNGDILVIDTTLSKTRGSYLELRHERLDEPRNAVDYELVMVPTKRAVHELAQQFGYSVATLKPQFRDYEGSRDYEKRIRRAFLCAKHTDISHLPVEVEPNEWRTGVSKVR
jgi:AraC-like DNA-binding protein